MFLSDYLLDYLQSLKLKRRQDVWVSMSSFLNYWTHKSLKHLQSGFIPFKQREEAVEHFKLKSFNNTLFWEPVDVVINITFH